MDCTYNEPDVWVGDRGATLLSFSATSLKDPVYERGDSRGTLHYSPILHQTFLRKSPIAPNLLNRLEFCYCTQRDLQTRHMNAKSTETRHQRALATHPKAFHFRKDCLREWKLDIPEVRKKRQIKKNKNSVILSQKALMKESAQTRNQIDAFEKSLLVDKTNEEEKKVANVKRLNNKHCRRIVDKKLPNTILHFNHVGGIGTTALTPRSIKKVSSLF